MKRAVMLTAALAVAMSGRMVGQTTPAGKDVHITVKYTAKGATVDDSHEIWVYLFDNPDISTQSQPIGVQAVTKNGGVATFKNVTVDPVYIAVAFDEKGIYDGNNAPPEGTPVAIYSTDKDKKAATPVPLSRAGKVVVTFDDTQRLGGAIKE